MMTITLEPAGLHRLRSLAWLVLGAVLPFSAHAKPPLASQTVSGLVVRVVDGDTIWVKTDAAQPPLKVRLSGMDAPEICQAGGIEARQALSQRVLHKKVALSFSRRDDYGRVLGSVRLDGEDVGRWMVSRGHAWSYGFRRYPGPYAAEQLEATSAQRGLYADPAAQRPGMFRKQHGSCHP